MPQQLAPTTEISPATSPKPVPLLARIRCRHRRFDDELPAGAKLSHWHMGHPPEREAGLVRNDNAFKDSMLAGEHVVIHCLHALTWLSDSVLLIPKLEK